MSDARDSRRPPTDVETLADVLAERAREGAGPEPEAGELLDYLEGRLSPEAEAGIERRLVASPEATRTLLDLADFAEAGAAAEARAGEEAGDEREEAPADLAVHAAWRDLRARLAEASAAGAAETGRPGRATRSQPWLAALAATLFVAVLGLGFQLWRLGDGGGPPEGVVLANVETLELFEEVRSGEDRTVEIEPGGSLQLFLHPEARCPSYRAELAGPGPGVRRRVELHRNELGQVSFLLLRAEPGRYTLRVPGCEPGHEVSTYGFEIVRPGEVTPGVNGL